MTASRLLGPLLLLAATLAVFIFSQIVIGLRWWILLRTQQIFIPFWAAVRLYFLGWFYNIVMPGPVGGDLVRLWYVTKHTDKKFNAALSVLVDRIVGLISTLIIAAFFYTVFLRPEVSVLGMEEQEALAGRSWSPELGVRFEVTRDDESLWVHRPGRDPERMQPGIAGEFEVGGVAILVQRDEAGTVTGLEIHAGRVTGLVLEKEGAR